MIIATDVPTKVPAKMAICDGCRDRYFLSEVRWIGKLLLCNDCILERLTDMGQRWGEAREIVI